MNTQGRRDFKDQLYQQLARVSRALANPHRLELVDLLAQSERSVEELAQLSGMSVANTSQHLKVLRAALLVAVRRQGAFSFYRLSGDGVVSVWQAIRRLGQEQFAEIDRLLRTFVAGREQLESVTSAELMERIRRDEVVVIDVRPVAEYQAGHIDGALSVPVEDLGEGLRRIPKNREVVAYCRGPFCVYADEAVAMLRESGYQARRLDVGFPDWKAAGLPTSAR